MLALIASVFIAQRSLYQHVAACARHSPTAASSGARKAVAMIVGRDPEQLDEAGVCRAAIESCAENFSDGVVAPVFWLALLGLPGLIAYKAINTADSMIGHRSERYESFGWAAARLDDLVNLVPARLSALLLAVAAPIAGGSIGTALERDAARRRKASLAECRLAGKRDGRRARPGAGRTAPLCRARGRRSLSQCRSDAGRPCPTISAARSIFTPRRASSRPRSTPRWRWWPDGCARSSASPRYRDALRDDRPAHRARLRSVAS